MEKAKVYFSDFRTKAYGDGLPIKLKKLIKKAGIDQIDMEGKFVAIKLHFGELGNISYSSQLCQGPGRCDQGIGGASLF